MLTHCMHTNKTQNILRQHDLIPPSGVLMNLTPSFSNLSHAWYTLFTLIPMWPKTMSPDMFNVDYNPQNFKQIFFVNIMVPLQCNIICYTRKMSLTHVYKRKSIIQQREDKCVLKPNMVTYQSPWGHCCRCGMVPLPGSLCPSCCR